MTETIYSILVIRRRVFKRSVVCILGIPMAEAVRQSRGRNWCGTLNNPGGDVKVEAVLRACADVRYACGQREVGGVNGTEHDQFYVEFSTTYTLSAVRGLLPRAHWEVRRGTKREARDYCRKEETRVPDTQWEIGVWVNNRGGRQGAREDLAVIQRRLAEGRTVAEIYEEYPQIAARYPRFVDRAADYATPERTWKTEVKVFKGPTGCGKTRLAHELYPGIWTKPAGVWFDSYDRHPHVLIDDFAGGRDCGISFRDLLRFLDRYPMDVPIKGVRRWVPESSSSPLTWSPETGTPGGLRAFGATY